MSDKALAQIIWDYMRFEEPLKSADLILALGSSDMRTADWAVRLFKEGYAPLILFTGGRGRISRNLLREPEAVVYLQRAIKAGVPPESMLIEPVATSTGENISLSYNLVESLGLSPKRIILITKPYMLRRAFATFEKQWPNAERVRVTCSAIDQSLSVYCKDPSYSFEYVVNVMVGDLQRIIEYPKRGFQTEQNIPDEVRDAYKELIHRGYKNHLLTD